MGLANSGCARRSALGGDPILHRNLPRSAVEVCPCAPDRCGLHPFVRHWLERLADGPASIALAGPPWNLAIQAEAGHWYLDPRWQLLPRSVLLGLSRSERPPA